MGDITRSTRKVMMDYDTRRQVEVFAEEAVHDFKNETPIFQKKIEDCLFCFEDFQYLDDRAIQKVLRDTDMQELAKALRRASPKSRTKSSETCPNVQQPCLKKTAGHCIFTEMNPRSSVWRTDAINQLR